MVSEVSDVTERAGSRGRKTAAIGGVAALGVAIGTLVWLAPFDGGTDPAAAAPSPSVTFAESKDVPLAATLAADEVRGLFPTVSRAERAALLDGAGVTFTVVVDGETYELTTAAETFGDALAQAGIVVGWDDDVAIDLSAPPVEGAEVRIGRVTTGTVTEQVTTPHETEERNTGSLDLGKTRVVQEGADGVANVTSTVRYIDGVEVSRTQLLSAVVSDPVTEVVEVGTRKPVVVAAPATGGGDSGGGSDAGSGASSGGTASTSAEYTLAQFKRAGVVNWDGKKFTYYSQSVLPGGGLSIPGRHVNGDGYVADGDGYIVLAAPYGVAHGTVYSTPFGSSGKVYDTCATCSSSPLWLDVYIK
ncbi:MAG: hypothetical protein BGO96_09435 [Micrococcales bacterium 73-15]|nr:MAG: hypothetical protein BGO96_09435 [Micrococcales bacterium 73-15]